MKLPGKETRLHVAGVQLSVPRWSMLSSPTRGGPRPGMNCSPYMQPVSVPGTRSCAAAAEPAHPRLRALAASNVHPMVGGLIIDALQDPDTPGTGVLVMAVPASPDRPHTVGQQDKLGIPWRDGPETRWMRERDLERAYRDRFEGRLVEANRLQTMAGAVRERIDPNRCWLVVTASPRSPRLALLPRPNRAGVGVILLAALARAAEVAPVEAFGRQAVLRELGGDAVRNPRIGLRRWVTFPSISVDASTTANTIYVELHDDGAVTFAVELDGWIGPDQQDTYLVPKVMVESGVADFVAVLDAAASALGVTGLLALRLDIVRFNKAKALTLVSQHASGNRVLANPEVVRGSRKVAPFMPVLSELTVPAEPADLQDAARQLAIDAINQFGVESLTVLGS
jgi:hypothetical protein